MWRWGLGGETTKQGEREEYDRVHFKERLWEVFRRACTLEGASLVGGGCFWEGSRRVRVHLEQDDKVSGRSPVRWK